MTTDPPEEGRRFRMPARVRIMAWVVLLMAAVLTLVNLVVWQTLETREIGRAHV